MRKIILSLGDTLFKYITLAVAVFTVVASAFMMSKAFPSADHTLLEETSVTLEDMRPEGTLYLMTAYTEDYVLHRDSVSSWLGLVTTHHSFLQMEHAFVHFTMNLDSVRYQLAPDEPGVVYVSLPEPDFRISSQRSPSMSDDEAFWSQRDTNPFVREVQEKIRSRYCTPENMDKARVYAWETLSSLMAQFGLEARPMAE